ncbi:MAG: PAS domain S-box protein [Ignavibacteriae bacterium]|nr:PAS domain S-box protein [Ignavibacteria bacterium]MBI3365869.1 PAS domain S-box protein [Ignavibacteriota bacterium]
MKIPFLYSLRFKVGFGYVVLVAINIAATAWAIYNFGRLTSSLNTILTENFSNIMAAEKMASTIEQHEDALSSIMNRDINNGKIKFTQAKDDFFQWFQAANDNRALPDAGSILDNIRLTYEGYLINSDSLIAFSERQEFERAKAYYANIVRPFSQRLSDNCFWLIEINQKEMKRVAKQTKSTSDEAIIAVLFATVFATVLSILTMMQFTKRIIEPAERLTQTVNQIGRGRLDLKIDIETNDEIGELSREFNKMTERLRKFEEMNIDNILAEKQKSETIVESISDALIVCDSEGTIQLMNRSAEDLLSVRETDVVGKPISAYLADDRLLGILRSHNDNADNAQRSSPYIQFNHKGHQVYVRPQVSEIATPQGIRRGVVLILQDVTQFKELDKMKSDFMAAVSHEFRTPLTSINMSVDILRQQILGPLTSSQEELLEASKRDCERLTKLIRELLQLSKLEAGKIEFREEVLDIRKVIESSVQPHELPFREKGVGLKLVLEKNMPRLVGDEQQLSWVISNLVSNALRYTNSGGCVEVYAGHDGSDMLLVQVKDTGRGISQEYLGKIFDKFVQVKQTFDSTPGSVGLGLAIAKEIIELYGGRIWVESEPGKGSTFSFRLPVERRAIA